MNLNDIIKSGDKFLSIDGTPAVYPHNKTRAHYRLATYAIMSSKGWYLLVEPALDGGLKKKTGEKIFNGDHFTQPTVAKTEQELLVEEAENRRAYLIGRMNTLDGGAQMARVYADHIAATGSKSSLPQAAQDHLTEMDALRTELAQIDGILVDSLIDETERSWLMNQILTSPTINGIKWLFSWT